MQYYNSEPLSSCNSKAEFNLTRLNPIVESLVEKWKSNTKDSFWKAQWINYGTCLSSIPEFSDELKYFSTGMKTQM